MIVYVVVVIVSSIELFKLKSCYAQCEWWNKWNHLIIFHGHFSTFENRNITHSISDTSIVLKMLCSLYLPIPIFRHSPLDTLEFSISHFRLYNFAAGDASVQKQMKIRCIFDLTWNGFFDGLLVHRMKIRIFVFKITAIVLWSTQSYLLIIFSHCQHSRDVWEKAKFRLTWVQ